MAASPDRPRIALLATGGTIAGTGAGHQAEGYTAGRLGVGELLAAVPGIERLARLEALAVAAIGSQDMDEAVWQQLADRAARLLAEPDLAGIVVTHGTDTMEETAFLLDRVLAGPKPVVLVGAMRPATALGAEGPRNLLEAVAVAARPEARGRGVMVVLDDSIHAARDVTKTSTTAVSTFKSPNTGPLGWVAGAVVRFIAPPAPRPAPLPLPGRLPWPRVDILYAHAGMPADRVTAALAAGAEGLVLAGVGDGNAPTAVVQALAAAVAGGVPVVRGTRASSGPVMRNIEIDDDALGFVAAYELNPAKARLLLQLLLAAGITDTGQLQAAFRGD